MSKTAESQFIELVKKASSDFVPSRGCEGGDLCPVSILVSDWSERDFEIARQSLAAITILGQLFPGMGTDMFATHIFPQKEDILDETHIH